VCVFNGYTITITHGSVGNVHLYGVRFGSYTILVWIVNYINFPTIMFYFVNIHTFFLIFKMN